MDLLDRVKQIYPDSASFEYFRGPSNCRSSISNEHEFKAAHEPANDTDSLVGPLWSMAFDIQSLSFGLYD